MSGNNTIQSLLGANVGGSASQAQQQSQSQQQTQQPQQAQQQQQNPQGNPSTVQSHQNNNPQFNADTGGAGGDNNSMQSLIDRVMSGSQEDGDRPTASSQQQHQSPQQQQTQQQQTGDAQDNNGTQAQQIVSNFMRLNNIDTNFLNGIEQDQLAERIGQGDIAALTEALETTAGNAFNQAMATMVQMLPAFADQIRSDVRREFGTMSKSENNWTDFAKEYPELGRHEKTIRPVLEQAIKSANGDVAQAQAAVAQIFAGLRETGDDNKGGGSNNRNTQQADSGFDLTAFLSAGK